MLGHHESLEEREMDYPRRFRYKDLYAETKGFKESEVIRAGGFGEVYKGTLPATGSEVAVKKTVRNSAHGMREFAAEIESLGRLRHKNLVNLQDRVIERHQMGQILDAVDPKLNSTNVVEEVQMVLELGPLCSHHKPEARPTMRQVTRYLSGDDPLPNIEDWGSVDSRSLSEMNSRMLESLISGETITTSYVQSTTRGISTCSIGSGR
ncbi:Lectin-domain containing receptor kinase VI.4 [Morella rubra]|uniref:Lectin-domain containing receptor kinase VI.4 n=1 Tax=Morella rubra TaxID=262757 RepID=A0A6A1V4Q1_9ROSI|nr:Lectin-domain containing receptor kinase VI.4 [Morella rubra]